MKHSDFSMGLKFRCGESDWLVTDIGTRTVIALQLGHSPDWYAGPPYALREEVFNEDDIAGCERVENLNEKIPSPLRSAAPVGGYPIQSSASDALAMLMEGTKSPCCQAPLSKNPRHAYWVCSKCQAALSISV